MTPTHGVHDPAGRPLLWPCPDCNRTTWHPHRCDSCQSLRRVAAETMAERRGRYAGLVAASGDRCEGK